MGNNNVFIIGLLALIIGFGVGYSVDQGSTEGAMLMHGAMDSMTSDLTGKTGDALDQAFLDGMIVHHEGAIDMARILLAGTERPELTKLGTDIITAQTGEIEMMKQWRRDWFAQ